AAWLRRLHPPSGAGSSRERSGAPAALQAWASAAVQRAVVEVNDAVAEAALAKQLEVQADTVGEGLLAASHHDRREEQLELVDQTSLERLGGELRTTHADVTGRSLFQLPDRVGLEGSLDPRAGAGH